jgi:uncharacterized membrane protein (DUF485 family)
MAQQPAGRGGGAGAGGDPPQAPAGGQRVGQSAGGGTGGVAHREDINWEAAENSREFKELVHRKRRFVVPATIFFFAWYFGFIVLVGVAPDFMAERLIDGFTVGYALALTQFIMTWALSYWYIRKADRDFDPLARRAAETAIEAGRGTAAGPRTGEVTAR